MGLLIEIGVAQNKTKGKEGATLTDNYAKLVRNNLQQLYQRIPPNLAAALGGQTADDHFIFNAFGETCIIEPGKILLGNKIQSGVVGILISLYARHAKPQACVREPFKAFKDLPHSMPYAGAFVSHTQQILVPYVSQIRECQTTIMGKLNGESAPAAVGGDFAFVVYALPKIALCYIFYESDEDFPASVTTLYANNALSFLPIDALADVGEYTSKKIIEIL